MDEADRMVDQAEFCTAVYTFKQHMVSFDFTIQLTQFVVGKQQCSILYVQCNRWQL
jgi:hypothetical protein